MSDRLFRIQTKRLFNGQIINHTCDRHSHQSTQDYLNDCKRKGVDIITVTEYVVHTYHYDKEENIDFGAFNI